MGCLHRVRYCLDVEQGCGGTVGCRAGLSLLGCVGRMCGQCLGKAFFNLCLLHSCEFSHPQTAAGKNQPRQSLIPILRDELFVYSKVSVWGTVWASLWEAIRWQLLLLYLCLGAPWAQASSLRILVYSGLEKSWKKLLKLWQWLALGTVGFGLFFFPPLPLVYQSLLPT